MSTTGQLSLDIGSHGPHTTRRPSLATISHKVLRTHWPSQGIINSAHYTMEGLGLGIMSHGPYNMH